MTSTSYDHSAPVGTHATAATLRLDDEDLALLRRVVVGLQEDLQDPPSPDIARRRVIGARTMAAVVRSRHPDASNAGGDWELAFGHVEDLCREVEAALPVDAPAEPPPSV
jgi:hypothetical protein